jgi:hypothetical protein
MSIRDQVEQQRLADLYHETRTPDRLKPPKPPRRKRAKDFAEGYMTARWALRTIGTFFGR